MSTVRDVHLDCIPAAMQIHSEGNDRHATGDMATLLSHLSSLISAEQQMLVEVAKPPR